MISRYYEPLDGILLRRLQELVADLYLAGSGPKRKRLWERAETAMRKLAISPSSRAHILEKRDAEVLAKNLEDRLKAARKKS